MDNFDIIEEEVVEFQELFVPDIASADPEERKLARRIRIQKRVDAIAKAQQRALEAVVDEKPEKPTLLQKQLEKSSEILKQLFLESEEIVTNIRVATDAREVDRRESEEVAREKILVQLEIEAELAAKMFDKIAEKWDNIMDYNDPLNIFDDIQKQKIKCDELIVEKDGVIAMLKHEIKMTDLKFFNDQKVQSGDISLLAKRVENQVAIMRAAHRIELQNIEDVMIQERTNMNATNDKRWEDLYKKREEQELAISENKFRQRDEFEDVVTKVRLIHEERVREVKIRLERDCETLQQEFESIKVMAMTNSEKMDYNYQILRKREDENIIIKSNQKRTLNKLQDQINVLRKRIADHKLTTVTEINKLYNEVINLQKYICAVRMKSKSMAKSNEQKYRQLWDLNQTVATKILNKLLTIDKLLHEQQMGINWDEPPNKLFKMKDLKSYVEGIAILDSFKEKPVYKSESDKYIAGNLTSPSYGYMKTLNSVLDRISEKSSFLVEYRLQKIMTSHSSNEKVLLKIDNVFAALGVTKADDVNVLFHFFKPYIRCPICSGPAGDSDLSSDTEFSEIKTLIAFHTENDEHESSHDNEVALFRQPDEVVDKIIKELVKPERLLEPLEIIKLEGECLGPRMIDTEFEKKVAQVTDYGGGDVSQGSKTCLNNHQLVVQQGCVLKAIKEFVTHSCKGGGEVKVVDVPSYSNQTFTLSRLMSHEDVKAFWDRFLNILDSKRLSLWDALLYGLQKYHAILEDRHQIYNKLKCVRKQNEELRHLLSQYRKEEITKPACAVQREIPIKSIRPQEKCTGTTNK